MGFLVDPRRPDASQFAVRERGRMVTFLQPSRYLRLLSVSLGAPPCCAMAAP